MQSRSRRRFLTHSTILAGSELLVACGGGGSSSAVMPLPLPPGSAGSPPDAPIPPASATPLPGTVPPDVVPAPTGLASVQKITGPWEFQAASALPPSVTGAQLAAANSSVAMSPAVVPGTALTSMIANGTYTDPLYGQIVTDAIPDTLKDTDYWYRTRFSPSPLQAGQRLWLHLEGVNYKAEVWLNGALAGTLEGAFIQGYFDVTRLVSASGGEAWLAVRVIKLDFSEGPLLPSYKSGVTRGQRNGGPTGVTLKNGPTFFCSAGWDWLPTIPDRNLGIWRPVSWRTTGPVGLADVRVDATLSPDLSAAELSIDLSLDNRGDSVLTGTFIGKIDGIEFRHEIQIPAGSKLTTVTLTSKDIPALSLAKPRLWWPNGYGEPHLYTFQASIEVNHVVSDQCSLSLGMRRIEYSRDIGLGAQLSIKVNDHPILVMGGNWGLDEAFKRIPRQRLFDQVRMHRDANLNLIRNWNGQSTSEDFFAACDVYGILVWQDFFYSTEGPAAANTQRDLDNIRDCIVHYRNHPSILLWCGGNEGSPPADLVKGLDALVKELDPKRLCLTSSAGDTGTNAVDGYSSGGPYHWVSPKVLFNKGFGTGQVAFRNEMGSYSIPTLESVQSMIPKASWECPDDFWADRDINANGGNSGGKGYIALIASRYGAVANLPDFVRKAQLMNYEGIKAIYESNVAVMIGPVSTAVKSPATGVIMWMSNPAQPSFVWQMYSHDLEQHSSFFAVQHGCRRVNVIMSASSLDLTISNHAAQALSGSVVIQVFNLDGTQAGQTTTSSVGSVPAASFKVIGNLNRNIAAATSAVCFVKLRVLDSAGATLAENFYWTQKSGNDTDYKLLDTMPPAAVTISASSEEAGDLTTRIKVNVKNTGNSVALMTHLQLFDIATQLRILPAFYSDNYLNLTPGMETLVTIDVARAKGKPLANAGIRVDGWKLDRQNSALSLQGVPVVFNERALATTNPGGGATFAQC
jgi:mannosylglycoprotein endo-beta-mannosidase